MEVLETLDNNKKQKIVIEQKLQFCNTMSYKEQLIVIEFEGKETIKAIL